MPEERIVDKKSIKIWTERKEKDKQSQQKMDGWGWNRLRI
jgi:hypothetical protein